MRVGHLLACACLVAATSCRDTASPPMSATPPTTPAAPSAVVRDPHSAARPEEARVTHVALDLAADFTEKTLAGTATLTLARTGSAYSNGSGDFAIAFSTSPEMRSRFNETAPRARQVLPTDATSPLFEAALEATEEAVYNSLFQATTVTSRFGTAEAIPVDRVRELLKK